ADDAVHFVLGCADVGRSVRLGSASTDAPARGAGIICAQGGLPQRGARRRAGRGRVAGVSFRRLVVLLAAPVSAGEHSDVLAVHLSGPARSAALALELAFSVR